MLLPESCREAPACIDYQAFIFTVPQDLDAHVYQLVKGRLVEMGRLRHEMLGVSYVDTEWGLLLVPPNGFDEMKVYFFHHITIKKIEQILDEIAVLLNTR